MARRAVVVANWKMQLSHKAELETIRALKKLLRGKQVTSDVVICPSYPTLPLAATEIVQSEKLKLGAQHVHWEEQAPLTGGVSVLTVAPFIDWCIVGHSDQRVLCGITDREVEATVQILLKHGIAPLICVGETAAERDAGQTVEKISAQMKSLLRTLTRAALSHVVIVYEPIWAISAHVPVALPQPAEIASTMLLIRKLTADAFEAAEAERLRVLYGGSVDAHNIASFMAEPGIDGALVGSASLRPREFTAIIETVRAAAE